MHILLPNALGIAQLKTVTEQFNYINGNSASQFFSNYYRPEPQATTALMFVWETGVTIFSRVAKLRFNKSVNWLIYDKREKEKTKRATHQLLHALYL